MLVVGILTERFGKMFVDFIVKRRDLKEHKF